MRQKIKRCWAGVEKRECSLSPHARYTIPRSQYGMVLADSRDRDSLGQVFHVMPPRAAAHMSTLVYAKENLFVYECNEYTMNRGRQEPGGMSDPARSARMDVAP
ncbi:hypothetical protein AG1IA_09660 [Rhizoctonia solani AG-1 IA]|uniref:Uncharacterized protein n=1 Tax=Thanatephorus cucumeris (strain AG1-IA) TaxID=983506 RepID=L8WHX5_THACA|nr:hypothetical protein AG1IA_09660 [Rhizoctonia solani AG-1 IA]